MISEYFAQGLVFRIFFYQNFDYHIISLMSMSKVKKNKVRHEQDAWELSLMAQELGSVYFKVFTSIEAAAKRQKKNFVEIWRTP